MLSLFLLLAPQSSARPAQRTGDETVVTARKLSEPLNQVPLSATALEAAEIEETGLLEVSDLSSRVPNVVFSEFSARRLSFPFVRGVGSALGDPSVITYVDDVPQFGFGGTNLPFVALERIEFLRGPQGTLYGKSALGGLIHVHGRRPTDERVLGVGAAFGSDDLREYSGSFSGPIGGGLLGDIAVLDSARDGFTTNDETGNKVDDRDAFFGRGRVLWNPSKGSELEFSIFGERARDGGFVLSDLDGLRDNPHHIDQDFEGLANRDVLNPALVWRVLGDELEFTSVSSWETWDVLETSDFDFSDADSVRRRSEEEQSYFYQELRLGSGGEHRTGEFGWQVGASGFLADTERQAANIFGDDPIPSPMPPPPGSVDLNDGQFDDLGLALFGQLTIPLGSAFELAGGLRYDRAESEVDSLHTFDFGTGPNVVGQIDDDETFDEFLPMASASWQFAAEALVYLRAAKGFKGGGFNLAAPAGKESFDAETAWSYELGWRQSFAEQRYSLGANVFFIDLEDMQVSLFDATAGGYVDNVATAESQGLELEGRAALGDALDGFATFGLLDTEIQEFVDQFGTDTSGNELPFAPDTTWSVGLRTDGELPSGALWTLAGDYTRIGSFFYDAGNREGDDFGLANVRLGVDSQSYGLSFWVRNLFDEEYEPVAFQPSPDPLAQDVFVGESGAPRVLGFSLSVHL